MMSAAIPSTTNSNGSVSPRPSPYTAPRLAVETGRVVYDSNRLTTTGKAAVRLVCEESSPTCHCAEHVEPIVARLLPVHSGVVVPAVIEGYNFVRGKVSAAAAVARVGVRWVARKVGGLLGKWFGAVVGTLFSPAGAIVGAAIGIAVGCAVARLVCAAM